MTQHRARGRRTGKVGQYARDGRLAEVDDLHDGEARLVGKVGAEQRVRAAVDAGADDALQRADADEQRVGRAEREEQARRRQRRHRGEHERERRDAARRCGALAARKPTSTS